jgi:hypothetical protein
MRYDITTIQNLVTHYLPLADWSFVENAKTDLSVIYNSPWCRIKFLIEKDRSRDLLHVDYGRLHALDNASTMKWKGEKYYCWHHYSDLHLALKFLDGTSPQDAFRQRIKSAPFIQDYYNSEFAKSIDNAPEQALRLHDAIWSHYRLQFFELFDLRRPEIWKGYTDFLKEFYKLDEEENLIVYKERGLLIKPFDPPLYKKC